MYDRDRRAAPRVIATTPTEVAARDSQAPRTVWGRLMDASSGGIAFISEDSVADGELLELSVTALDGRPHLEGVVAKVVGTRIQYGDHVAHCAFVTDGLPDSWPGSLSAWSTGPLEI
jgi:PilZ domain